MFGFIPTDNIDLINVAKSGGQADIVFFNKVGSLLQNWKWLRERFTVKLENRNISDGKHGHIVIGGDKAIFPGNIRFLSLNSSYETWEGLNVVFFVLDEISGFVTPTEQYKAAKILKTAETSCISRKSAKFSGFGLVMSFPRQEDDIIFAIEERSKKPGGENISVTRGFPWEFKPFDEFYCGKFFEFKWKSKIYQVPIELRTEFEQRPEESAASFLCDPAGVSDPFFTYPEKLLACVRDVPKLMDTDDYFVDSDDGFMYLHKRIVQWNHQEVGLDRRYVIHVDAAEKVCDAVMSIGYGERVSQVEDPENPQYGVRVVIVGHYLWHPDPTRKLLVSSVNIDKFLGMLFEKLRISYLSFDHWNSAAAIEKARMARVRAEQHNITVEDYKIVRGLVYSGMLYLPNRPIWVDPLNPGHDQPMSYRQLRLLGQEKGRIIHPSERKDLADTIAGVCRNIITYGIVSRPGSMGMGCAPLGTHGIGIGAQPVQDFPQLGRRSAESMIGSEGMSSYPSHARVGTGRKMPLGLVIGGMGSGRRQ